MCYGAVVLNRWVVTVMCIKEQLSVTDTVVKNTYFGNIVAASDSVTVVIIIVLLPAPPTYVINTYEHEI